jgi:hypothetical protein
MIEFYYKEEIYDEKYKDILKNNLFFIITFHGAYHE